ncbi:hemolysin family protein [uncultured Tessaracoccus sp.]|uniref:hemolysin family protein n=1 Tax=uncultured Tessaracoccus sp. TaxID=905023 RepID=UPI0025CE6FEA|nr:hemolysin family protein [uncultured Tessaracoccus sp.]
MSLVVAEWPQLVVALLCAVVACVLASVEAAVQSTTKGRAERLVAEEPTRANRRIVDIAQDPAPTINSLMFARMAFEITAIAIAAMIAHAHLDRDWIRVLVTVAIMLLVSFVLWGVAPRTLGRQHPVGTLRLFGWLASAVTTVLNPVAQLMVLLGNALTPGRGYADGPFATEAEFLDLVSQAEEHDVIEDRESRMVRSVFELDDTLVKEVMVPRTDMVFIRHDHTLRQMLSLALRSGFSRIPVIGEDVDDIRGIAYVKDVSKRIFDYPDAERGETVSSVMRTAEFCPDSKPVSQLLKEMQRTHSHMVVVVDEFGGTSGLATIEDILEEIVGEIVDEYDREVPAVVDLGEGRFRISSRLSVSDLGDLFDMDLDDQDVDTVWGLMAKQLELVPIPGSRTVHEGIEMIADRAIGRRHQIATVLVRRIADEEPDADQEEDDDD